MYKFFTKKAKSFHSGESGFTLIELLIVIVILGVLAAAIIPNLSKFVGSGTVGAANAELATVKTAISAFEADNNGNLPTAASPGATTGGAIVNAAILPYVSGTVGIKGVYTIDATGAVTAATNGTWSTTIQWSGTDGNLQWEKKGS